MHILGLDFATQTGVAYGDAGAPPSRIQTETWSLPGGGGEDVGEFMHALRARLDDRIMRGVQLVIFEAPYVAMHRGNDQRMHHSPNQIRRAFGAAAMCEEVCYARGVECREVVTVTLKKEFAFHGHAKKPDMIRAAQARGFRPQNDHEADALACFTHIIIHDFPHFAHLYDPFNQFARVNGS